MKLCFKMSLYEFLALKLDIVLIVDDLLVIKR